MEKQELNAWLRLTLSPGVGNETARRLLAAFGSAQGIFEQSAQALRQLGSEKLANSIQAEPETLRSQLQTTLDWLAAGDDRLIVTLGDAAYPASLLDIEDPPLMLYTLGAQVNRAPEAIKNVAPCLAIVGSRNPTPQGEANARQFAKAFGASGVCIVSGMALGIDGAAHDGALQGGDATGCATIAVIGTGLDRVYPKKHLTLAHRIAEHGMIISEFPLGTPPLTANFPKRNRIISGLSQGVLVVEAALKSGSLITARLASEQGKDVFAIPGSIHSPQSRGCHALIKQGAKLVETAQDVLEELKIPSIPLANDAQHGKEASDPDQTGGTSPARLLLKALGFDVCSLDSLQARTGIATPLLQAQLLELEMDGHVVRLPGGLFQRLATA
ncbi:MAG: DNA-protecting protein DprA [Polaromonas sp.]|nr:DNA-protecting protein DprA [Polaromonas sp.]